MCTRPKCPRAAEESTLTPELEEELVRCQEEANERARLLAQAELAVATIKVRHGVDS